MVDVDRVLALAEAADPVLATPDEASAARLEAARDDIAPAIEWAIHNDLPRAVRLVASLATYWPDAGRLDEGRRATEQVVGVANRQAATDRDVAAHIARALLAAAELAFRQGDYGQAAKRARDTIRGAMLIEDRTTTALAHNVLAQLAYRERDADAIEKHARKALELAGDDRLVRAGALQLLARAAHTSGNLDEAERRFEESLRYRRELGDRVAVAAEIANLGDLALERGEVPRAAQLLGEALALSRATDSRYMLVNTLPSFASLAVRGGLISDAARIFGAADSAARRTGVKRDPQRLTDEDRARARDTIGRPRFDELAREGKRLTPDEAIELARTVARRIGGDAAAVGGAKAG